jgi:hypothetical protein
MLLGTVRKLVAVTTSILKDYEYTTPEREMKWEYRWMAINSLLESVAGF